MTATAESAYAAPTQRERVKLVLRAKKVAIAAKDAIVDRADIMLEWAREALKNNALLQSVRERLPRTGVVDFIRRVGTGAKGWILGALAAGKTAASKILNVAGVKNLRDALKMAVVQRGVVVVYIITRLWKAGWLHKGATAAQGWVRKGMHQMDKFLIWAVNKAHTDEPKTFIGRAFNRWADYRTDLHEKECRWARRADARTTKIVDGFLSPDTPIWWVQSFWRFTGLAAAGMFFALGLGVDLIYGLGFAIGYIGWLLYKDLTGGAKVSASAIRKQAARAARKVKDNVSRMSGSKDEEPEETEEPEAPAAQDERPWHEGMSGQEVVDYLVAQAKQAHRDIYDERAAKAPGGVSRRAYVEPDEDYILDLVYENLENEFADLAQRKAVKDALAKAKKSASAQAPKGKPTPKQPKQSAAARERREEINEDIEDLTEESESSMKDQPMNREQRRAARRKKANPRNVRV